MLRAAETVGLDNVGARGEELLVRPPNKVRLRLHQQFVTGTR
jgi:hypothetical protein